MMLKFFVPYKEKNEEIILLVRRHWFIMLRKLLFFALIAILPFVFYWVARDFFISVQESQIFSAIFILFVSIYYLYVWLFIFYAFVDYYLDVWIVTNKRIVNIEQKGLFAREVAEQRLYRVQDVTSDVKGLFSTLLDYGNVHIQTAGETPRFVFKQVPRPYRVSRKIISMAEQSKRFKRVMEKDLKSKSLT